MQAADEAAGAGQALLGLRTHHSATSADPNDPSTQAQEALTEVERTASQAQQRADELLAELENQLDLETLQAMAEKELQSAQSRLSETQDELEEILADDEPTPADSEPKADPVAPAAPGNNLWDNLQAPMLLMAGTAATFGFIGWLIGQSATVGAGAAGTAAARGGRKFLPYASPLFTRFEKDTVLGHPKREAIYGTIVEKPGSTLQDLCDATGLSRTAVTHHLRLIEQQHLVVSKRVGRSRHFFENGGRYGRDQKDAYAVLHNDRSKDIHGFIRKNPGSIQKDLCAAFGIQASVAHWHIKRLVDANLVEAIRQGRTVSYFPSAQTATGYA